MVFQLTVCCLCRHRPNATTVSISYFILLFVSMRSNNEAVMKPYDATVQVVTGMLYKVPELEVG